MQSRSVKAGLLLLFFAILALSWPSLPAGRAQPDIAEIQITNIDTSLFPEISARMLILTSDGSRAADVSVEDLELVEDGQQVTSFQLDESLIGIQVVFVIDASSNITEQGATGSPRVEECREAILRFVEVDPRVQDGIDWVTVLIAQSPEAGVINLVGPTSTPREVYNALYPYQVPTRSRFTDLYDSLFEAIRLLDRPVGIRGMHQAIVVFSDGVDITSDIPLSNIVLQANQHGIPIHSILLGQSEPPRNNNLLSLATQTGGQYVHLTSADAVDEVLDRIAEQRNQYVVTYRSRVNQSGAHVLQVRATSAVNSSVVGEGEYAVTIHMPRVEIISPEAGTDITRTVESPWAYRWASLWNRDVDLIEPDNVSVRAQVLWPDGQARTVTRAELLVNGNVVDSASSPAGIFELEWGLTAFTVSGDYDQTLAVGVYDDLGLRQESDASQVHLHVEIPRPIAWEAIGGWICGGLGFLLSLTLLAVLIAKREAIYAGVRTGIRRVQETIKYGRKHTKAYLEILEGEEVARPIPIRKALTKIGRDPQYAEVLFHQSRPESPISRLHCTVIEKDGKFSIRDESSGNGTYVKHKQLAELEEEPLDDGDEIELAHVNLGGIRLRFRLATPDGSFPEETKPYQRPSDGS